MNETGQDPADALPLPLARQLDQACNRFEAAWRNGERPDVEAFVAGVAEEVRGPLRQELARLDSYYRSLRDTPRGEPTVEDFKAAASVTRPPAIPGYEILAELGRGGMGVVYKVRQTSVNRLVALKMILAGGHAGQTQLARFLAEAEAVAQLEHPNLVRLYEVGQHDGLPYFTMEFVAGGSLSQRLDGTPLPATEAARLVEQLAQGMDYAHQRGIVHRDLKPGNVLLQESGVRNQGSGVRKQESGKKDAADTLTLTSGSWIPKVTDFGLAKRVETGEGMTATGAVLGTPSYMAPEQAEGKAKEVGPAADIYALGAILYQCLTGRPPFRGPAPLDTIRQVIGDEPVPPARLNPTVPRDLETICLKCLQKDPRKRYADAGELARDLHRFQAGEPIQARPVGRLERAVRWVRKRPATAALLALVTLFLVGGVAGLFWYQQQRLAGLVHQQGVDNEIARALDDAEQLPVEIHRQLADPVEFFELLSDIESWKTTLDRARAAWERADRLTAANPGVLDPALLTRVQTVAGQRDADEADWRLAKKLDDIRLQAAILVTGKYDPAKADPNYIEFFGRLGFDFDNGDPAAMAQRLRDHRLRYVLVAALDHWGQVLDQSDTSPGVARRMPRVLRTARLADPDPWRDQVRDPNNWKNRELLAKLARDIDYSRQSPQVVGLLGVHFGRQSQERVALLRNALLHHPRDFWLNYDLGSATKDLAEQIGCYRAALAIRPKSSATYNNLGKVLDDMNDADGAIRHYEKAIAIDPSFAAAHNNLGGSFYAHKKDLKGAIRCYKEAIRLDPKLAPAYYNLGIPLRDLKDWDGAIKACEKAIALKANYGEAYRDLALALEGKNDLDGAIRNYEKAIAINPDDLRAHGNLGNALRAKKDFDRAIRHYEKVIAIDPNDAGGHNNLGLVFLENKKDLKRAIVHLEKAIAIDPNDAGVHTNLGNAFGEKKDFEKAVKHYEKAIDLDPTSVDAHSGLSSILRLKNDLDGAIRHGEKAIAINPNLAVPHNILGRALLAKNQLDRAVEQFEKAIAIDASRAEYHRNLGAVLAQKHNMPEAIRHLNKALDLDPNDVDAHYNLGLVLMLKKDFDGALRHYEKAVAIDPQHAEATCNLGLTYREKGEFEKAVAFLKRGHELGSAQPGWHYPSEQWLKHSQQLLAADRKLSAILRGQAQAAGWQEQLFLADLCWRYKQQYAAAAGFYAQGLAANPKVTSNPEWQLRWRAAICAAQAGAAQGKDAAKLDHQAKSKLRQQALDWLQADLDLYDKALQSLASEQDTLLMVLAVNHLAQWQRDPALASVRDDKALAALSADEQKMWRQLWSHAADLAKKAREAFHEATRKGKLSATKREEAHTVKLQAGKIVIIDMESPQFDTYLRLEDDRGKILAENDDISPDNLNSRLVFTVARDGAYRIIATSYQQRGQGDYTLTIRELKASGPKN
jgi:serine/threonine-protein kinase